MNPTLRNVFWLIVIGLVSMYAFFLALGTFDPTETTVATLIALVAAVAWGIHMWMDHVHRREHQRDPALRAARERRGF